MDSFIWLGVSALGIVGSDWSACWSVGWSAFCVSLALSKRNATALIMLAVASGNLSDVFRVPVADTIEKRIVAIWEHVIFCLCCDHCFSAR